MRGLLKAANVLNGYKNRVYSMEVFWYLHGGRKPKSKQENPNWKRGVIERAKRHLT